VARKLLRKHGARDKLCGKQIRGGGAIVSAKHVPAVFIRTLGAFQVIRDGTPVPSSVWRSKKACLLLILIARREATSREQLIELLWPEEDLAKAGNRLSVLLWTLRNVLQPYAKAEPLVSNGGLVWLDPTHVGVDVEEFLTDANAAFAAHQGGQPDATERLMSAAAAHTGDFLEDQVHQDWATPLAEEVRATHIALLRALAARLWKTGDIDEAVRYLLRLLGQDPFDEQAHLDLVNMQLEAGRLGEARRYYDIYVKRMIEIGMHPQSQFQERRGK
jgi:DNA-binding SARP family transcriptional activator